MKNQQSKPAQTIRSHLSLLVLALITMRNLKGIELSRNMQEQLHRYVLNKNTEDSSDCSGPTICKEMEEELAEIPLGGINNNPTYQPLIELASNWIEELVKKSEYKDAFLTVLGCRALRDSSSSMEEFGSNYGLLRDSKNRLLAIGAEYVIEKTRSEKIRNHSSLIKARLIAQCMHWEAVQ